MTGECTELVYEQDIKGFFSNWCTPCHSAKITGIFRQGAPETINFDTIEGMRPWAERIAATALADAPTMPPAGGTTVDERALIREWIECGMPADDTPVASTCDDATPVSGALSLATQADADSFCAQGPLLNLDGNVSVSGDVSVDCLCQINGDVSLSAGSLAGDQLRAVEGNFSITGATTATNLPDLREVSGDLWIYDAPNLATLDLNWLRTLGGSLVIERCDQLSELQIRRLASTGGETRFEALPALTNMYSVESINDIGGDLIIRDTGLLALDEMWGFIRIEGGVYIDNNDHLVSITNFIFLAEVADVLSITDNAALTKIIGFERFEQTEATLVFERNPLLEKVRFPALLTAGDLTGTEPGIRVVDAPSLSVLSFPLLDSVSGLYVETTGLTQFNGAQALTSLGSYSFIDNALLEDVTGAPSLTSVASILLSENPALLEVGGFDALTAVNGDLTLSRNTALTQLGGLNLLTDVAGSFVLDGPSQVTSMVDIAALRTVNGTLQVSNLGQLTDLTDWYPLTRVGGDLIIENNATLTTADANTLAAEIDTIGGSVLISNNQQ